MNQKANNDIDILLRRLSRQAGTLGNASPDGQHAEEHLDADELNAYAENALPAATRARYTEHLTECNSCRHLVTQLSLAAATVISPPVEESRPSALKMFLATLFSPMVFRYAVPAMAILVVAAIAWVAVQRKSPTDLAQNMQTNAPTSTPSQANTSAPTPEIAAKTAVDSSAAESRGVAKVQSPDAAPAQQQPDIVQERKVTTEDRREELSKRDQPPSPAPAAGAGTAAAPIIVPASPKSDVAADRSDVGQKKEAEVDKTKPMNQPAGEFAKSESRQAKTNVGGVTESVQSAPGARARSLRRESTPKDENTAKNETEASEVRTVSGHRFQKRGQVWVDSLYSSQSIINVSRGSEQYRALVADEPGIRSIAEQLDGEFIVVWKGRAYRIR